MIMVNKIVSIFMMAIVYGVMHLFKIAQADRIEVILALVFFSVLCSEEDVRDMWKGRKP